MNWELRGLLSEIETIAVGSAIRNIEWLRQEFGRGRWRKLKGIGTIRLADGTSYRAELHWYEAHGIGREAHT